MTDRARRLRHSTTDAEKKLWQYLRQGQVGVSFRRQHPIGPYVLDFYCPLLDLAIELDGGQHGQARGMQHDAARTKWLAEKGITLVRFWNNDVMQNVSGVVETILATIADSAASKTIPTPTLPFSRGGSQAEDR